MDVEEQRAVKRRREVQSCAREVHSDGSVHAPDRLVQKIQPQPGKPAPVSMATNRAVQLLPRQDRDRSELHFVTYSGVFHCRSCLGRSLGQGQCWFLACLTGWGTLAFLVGLRALGVTFAAMCWETDADAIRVSKKSFRHVRHMGDVNTYSPESSSFIAIGSPPFWWLEVRLLRMLACSNLSALAWPLNARSCFRPSRSLPIAVVPLCKSSTVLPQRT